MVCCRKAFDFSRMTLKDHPNLGIMLVNVGNPKNGLRMLQLSVSPFPCQQDFALPCIAVA